MGIEIRQPLNHKKTTIKGAFGDDNVVELGDGRNIIILTGLDSTVILGDGAGNYIRFIDPKSGGGGTNHAIVGNGGNSTIIGAKNSQNVLISNGGAGDRVYGGDEPDILMAMGPGAQAFGRAGNDMLAIGRDGYGYGGPGNDSLQGYDGSTLHGGPGRDTFVPIVLGPETRVTISDFNPLGDKMNLVFLGLHAPGGVQVAQKGDDTVFSYTDPDRGAATLTLAGTGAALADFAGAVSKGWVINAPDQL